jgi:hypothetical protein
MYKNNGWNLKEPSLILSVMGSNKYSFLPKGIVNAFQNGLANVVNKTKAWVLTNGTRKGVNTLVSEIYNGEVSKDNLVLIGIAQWGTISNKEVLIVRKLIIII